MRAIYAFSGDPITHGHIDVVSRAAATYPQVTVAIGENPQKEGRYLFAIEERLALTQYCLSHFPNVQCVIFNGLLGEYAYRNGFDVIIRGIRNNTDLEGELVQFAVSQTLHPTVDTVFFPTRRQLSHISSGVVKAIVAEGGDVSAYCPLFIKEQLEKRILGRLTVGIAGGIAVGKTFIAKRLVSELQKHTLASYISLDHIGHHVLENTEAVIFQKTRERITRKFGKEILNSDGTIDRKALGKIVFPNPIALADLNEIMHEPMMAGLYEMTRELPRGVLIIEGAILVEARWTNLVNNNVILVDAPEDIRMHRLTHLGDMHEEEARSKINRQISSLERRSIMDKRIAKHNWGRIWALQNDGSSLDLSCLVKEIIQISQSQPLMSP